MAFVNNGPCDIGELLTAYVDGELAEGELALVVAHLGDCLDCVLEFHQLKETRAAMRSLAVLEPPDWLLPASHYSTELSSYLDGELPTVEYQAIHHHVQACAECRSNLYDLDVARTAVRSLPGLDLPEFLHMSPVRVDGRRAMPTRVVAAVAGMAAAAVLVIGVRVASDTPVPPVDLDSFADRHVARASVEPGFQVIPAVSPRGLEP
jgi:anti-sigma factor RsiW